MILDIMNKYNNNLISAVEYDKEMMKGHRVLLEYVQLLKNSVCSKIEIVPEGVRCEFTFQNKSFKMYLDGDDLCAVSVQLLAYNEYETIESIVVAKITEELEENSVIFDVGANLGWYTLLMNSIKPSSEFFLFEPAEKTYKRLCKNIQENGIDSKKCYNKGLYKKNQEMDFYFDTTASGASSLVDLRELDTTLKTRCKLVKLDDFVQENGIKRLDFIKCDVEGSELFVYQGGIETIRRNKPIIFSEMLRKWSAKFHYHPNDIIKLLSETGYQCFVIDENSNLKKFGFVDENTLETNYFFFDLDKHKQILQKLGHRF